ncbi:TetR/AcrR family transcriptional regulator [Cellulomonas sp. URHD0024]|uniref:TetR/AcrR family transcriptional regulator n=1 Tax=Cellulomonas sp. URHD0024 TaxID=1302620 RepID=UPI0003FB77B7|nr:TetR/AcrR family transcriptional regulator [Cellulomonas sp. URHD0024]
MDDVEGTQDAGAAAREAEEARREAEALRRDREKAERAEAKEAERARRDHEKAERDAARAAERRQRDADRRVRDREKAEREDRERREREARDAAREAATRLREAERAERTASLAQQRAARDAEKARRQAVRVAASTAPASGDAPPPADLPPGIAVLWRAPAVGRPGPRPGLSLEQIADAGIALADAEGLDGVSMSRLAESLGFTTMSLYRYVSSKDEVLSLMSDRAAGRPPATGPELGGWRERLEFLLSVQQPVLRAHPWLARTTTMLHAIGPGRLAWMEGMLAALEDTPLTELQKTGAIGVLATHALDQLRVSEQLTTQARAAAVGSSDGDAPDLGTLIGLLTTSATHPALVRAADAGAFSWDSVDQGTLDFGTQLILDGIAQLIAATAASRPQPQTTSSAPGMTADVSDPAVTLGA